MSTLEIDMADEVTAALIVGTLGLLVPIVAYVLERRKDQNLIRLSVDHQKTLAGKWHGDLIQEFQGKGALKFPVLVELKAKRKRVVGEGTIIYGKDRPTNDVRLIFEGGLLAEQHLLLTYKNADPAKIQFGTFILRLSNNGLSLEGKCLGYGVDTEALVPTDLKLTKNL